MRKACVMCGGPYKKDTTSEVFLDKYIKKDIQVLRCDRCGHEVVPVEEVEKVYQEIRKIENSNIVVKVLRNGLSKAKMVSSDLTIL